MNVTKIYAVEISGACNLTSTCSWCPMYTGDSRVINRPRGFMTEEVLERALYWVRSLEKPDALALHVFGEPLLHKNFIPFAKKFSEITPITMSTNGLLIDDEKAKELSQVKWSWISVSPWDEVAKARSIEALSKNGIATMMPSGVLHNWGGQSVTGGEIPSTGYCGFLQDGLAVIRWNGDIASCCISDQQDAVIGHVNDEPGTVKQKYHSTCEKCHHRPKDSGDVSSTS